MFQGPWNSGLPPKRNLTSGTGVRRKIGLRNQRRPDHSCRFSAPIMNAAKTLLSHQGHRLLQLGVAFIFYSSFAGFAIPVLASQRIGLSVHTLSALQGVFLLAVGLLWPKLRLGIVASWAAFWLFIYGAASILAAYTIAAIWGVGNETIMLAGELPHGRSHGTAFPRDPYQSAGVFLRADRSGQLYADPLGSSHYKP